MRAPLARMGCPSRMHGAWLMACALLTGIPMGVTPRSRLGALTGRRWMVVVSAAAGQPTVRARIQAQQEEFKRGVQADPLVQTVLARFPGAQIVAVRQPERDAATPLPAADDDEPVPEPSLESFADDDGSAFGAHGRPDDVDDDF